MARAEAATTDERLCATAWTFFDVVRDRRRMFRRLERVESAPASHADRNIDVEFVAVVLQEDCTPKHLQEPV